jgi:hypothetical protein
MLAAAVTTYAREQLRHGIIEAGTANLEPRWYSDYAALVSEHIATLPVPGS